MCGLWAQNECAVTEFNSWICDFAQAKPSIIPSFLISEDNLLFSSFLWFIFGYLFYISLHLCNSDVSLILMLIILNI